MNPPEFPVHITTGFIGMYHRRFNNPVFEYRFSRLKSVMADNRTALQGRNAQFYTENIPENLLRPLYRQQLLDYEVGRKSLESISILNRCIDTGRKFSGMYFSACAHNGLGLMLGYQHCYLLRQVKNLLFRRADNPGIRKAPTARTLAARSMDNRFVRIINHPERGSFVPLLPAGFLTGFFAQAFRWAFKPITGRWLAAVVTVFCQNGFKMGDPVFQCLNRLLKCVKKGIGGFEAFIVNQSELLFTEFWNHKVDPFSCHMVAL
jgi:hypothetical protein